MLNQKDRQNSCIDADELARSIKIKGIRSGNLYGSRFEIRNLGRRQDKLKKNYTNQCEIAQQLEQFKQQTKKCIEDDLTALCGDLSIKVVQDETQTKQDEDNFISLFNSFNIDNVQDQTDKIKPQIEHETKKAKLSTQVSEPSITAGKVWTVDRATN